MGASQPEFVNATPLPVGDQHRLYQRIGLRLRLYCNQVQYEKFNVGNPRGGFLFWASNAEI